MSDAAPPPSITDPKTSATAIWAIATGMLCIPLLPIILGIVALSEVKKSGGSLTGQGLGIFGIVLGCLHVVIIPAVAALVIPVLVGARRSADRVETINNARNLGIYLFAFEHDWGTFPSEKILRENPERFPGVRPGDSSNALLSMLIAGGYGANEEIFYAKGGAGISKKPDGVITPPSRLLEPGECGFGYVMMPGGRAMSTKNNGGRPLLVAPLAPEDGGADPLFNGKPYNGRAFYLRVDQSVKQQQIDKETGRVVLPGNTHLFETGPDTVWGEDEPDVRMPE